MRELVVNSNLVENENEQVQITKQRSQLQTHRFLADQMKARAEARISSPSFINTPHKAPKKTLKRKIQFSDTLEDLNNELSQPKKKINTGKKLNEGRSLNEKVFLTLSEGLTVKTLELGVYQLTIQNDPARCYTVNLKQKPTCTCPHFETIVKSRPLDRNTLVCKHIVVMLLFLGFNYNSKILRKYAYNATDRVVLELKMATFAHTNVDISEIKTNFEKEMNPRLEEATQEIDLPYFNPKKYYGQYNSYQEAKLFIEEQKERYPCKWFGLQYEEKRYSCTSACHTTLESKKLRQKLSQNRPLVFLVYCTRIFLNKNTGKYSARDEKKYFHMQNDCISNFGRDFITFSNIKPPFDVDISRLSKENRGLVRTTFPNVTFVADDI